MRRSIVFALAAAASLASLPACVDKGARAADEETCDDGDVQDCEDEYGAAGSQSCEVDDDGHGEWGECVIPPEGGDGEYSTPLVLAFDGATVRYHHTRDAFDLGAPAKVSTDWPTAATPWLVLDRDGDRRIADGRELFGSMTPLAAGGAASNGFQALAELDTNGDGRIDAADPAWSSLELWWDHDGDRRSDAGELRSLAAHGVEALSLGYRVDRRCDARGNCEVERASFLYRDAGGDQRIGEVVDVHLRHR
ncbi:MAG: hypothetical protein R3B09_17255 [Nannocystaceae bacterium]